MSKERLYLYDTTLRDGAQTTGVDFSVEDKRRIAAVLDDLGVDYVEGGYPGANATDTEFFAERPPLKRARFTAFGMTKRAGRSVSNDAGLQSVLQSKADSVCLVAKAWDYHVRVALGISNEENLDSIAQSVRAIAETQREAMIDCEHFFDGWKGHRDYALSVARTAYEAGARWVVLCDTNGGTLPHEVERIVADVVKVVPGSHLGIHTHNDTDNAVANSLVAVRAGCRQVQGTLNGLGERCGNANMTSIIPTLLLKSEFAERFETGVTPERLRTLTHASRVLDEILNRSPNRHAPYVGESAFATKAGIHASAILKDPETYEHVPPESVGNERRLLVSQHAGTSNILASLDRDARFEVAGADLVHGLLQLLKSSRQATHDGPRGQRDEQRDGAKESNDVERGVTVFAPLAARDEPAPVWHLDRPRRPASAVDPAGLFAVERRGGQQRTALDDGLAVGAVEREIELQSLRETVECLFLLVLRRRGRGQRDRRKLAGDLERLPNRAAVGAAPPEQRRNDDDKHQRKDDDEVDLRREPLHAECSPASVTFEKSASVSLPRSRSEFSTLIS